MRGADRMRHTLFAMRSPDRFAPIDHSLWPACEILNAALKAMNRLFAATHAKSGRAWRCQAARYVSAAHVTVKA